MKISNSKERTLMSRSVKQSGEDKIGTKEEPVTEISSVDEDCSKGMKSNFLIICLSCWNSYAHFLLSYD